MRKISKDEKSMICFFFTEKSIKANSKKKSKKQGKKTPTGGADEIVWKKNFSQDQNQSIKVKKVNK